MAYTEFYCQNGGSNVNAGSTNNNTPIYTKAHGNWTNSTGVFTVQDGTNPSSSVSVGDWCAVMVDGGTVAAWIARVSAVQNANNGTITVNTNGIGSKPANQTGTCTITDGGAWQGPNGASAFPFGLTNYGQNKDANGHQVRTNLKNDQTYSITSGLSFVTGGTANTIQGYSSSLEDGGKATFDGGTSTGVVISTFGTAGLTIRNIIFKTSITSGSTTLVTTGATVNMIRCVITGARVHGLSGNGELIECESYGNNTSNTTGGAGVVWSAGNIYRAFVHDNSGTNSDGIRLTGTAQTVRQSILANNARYGLTLESATNGAQNSVTNCEFYNNGSDAINVTASTALAGIWIENCNFIKNTGAGINNTAVANSGYVYSCGYGAGTQANGSADTLNNLSTSGAVTYPSNVTPWVDPANGDFRINLAQANFAGRGAFTETATGQAGTIGYPDIGAAQSLTGTGGTFSKKSSHVFCG